MDADKQAQLKAHARAIAELLYEETDPDQVKTLEGIEKAVRGHMLEHVSPQVASFLSRQVAAAVGEESGRIQSIVGQLSLNQTQANHFQLKRHTRWSPYLERCCLLLSANESYQRASEDIEVLTGMAVSRGTQQRLVHRQGFEQPVGKVVEESSIDGGKVRLRTPQGKPCIWRDYKAVNLHKQAVGAFFQDNASLLDWVNQQALATPLVCLGDGHDGIWNLFREIGRKAQRCEILDWFHLVENLGKVGGSSQRLDAVEACLWRGDVDGAIAFI